MPYINISTSSKVGDKKKLLEEISILVSSLTNKSKRFVMAKLDDNCEMYFLCKLIKNIKKTRHLFRKS